MNKKISQNSSESASETEEKGENNGELGRLTPLAGSRAEISKGNKKEAPYMGRIVPSRYLSSVSRKGKNRINTGNGSDSESGASRSQSKLINGGNARASIKDEKDKDFYFQKKASCVESKVKRLESSEKNMFSDSENEELRGKKPFVSAFRAERRTLVRDGKSLIQENSASLRLNEKRSFEIEGNANRMRIKHTSSMGEITEKTKGENPKNTDKYDPSKSRDKLKSVNYSQKEFGIEDKKNIQDLEKQEQEDLIETQMNFLIWQILNINSESEYNKKIKQLEKKLESSGQRFIAEMEKYREDCAKLDILFKIKAASEWVDNYKEILEGCLKSVHKIKSEYEKLGAALQKTRNVLPISNIYVPDQGKIINF
ncbi:hypothetical protein AYI68_g1425 [Smittium mucronatum]|uniref:Uncharacterized protein n=1 Tax=Smittium mucronatum TaxID=133383 RepID=A0A1R0H5P2_9FUNG|nr:hypothetical protein AYI68_g1425 [Smittium mucronatum]